MSPRTLMLLGNCVASRLQSLLPLHSRFAGRWQLVPAPMIHCVYTPETQAALAVHAAACDIVLSQPLFSYGACNTAALRRKLGRRLITFSSPDFPAYFPDVCVLDGKKADAGTPLEWDSRIIFACYVRGIPVQEVPALYVDHPVFSRMAMAKALAASQERYAQRDTEVDVSTVDFVASHWADIRLFHTPRHPADALLALLLRRLCFILGLPEDHTLESQVAAAGFGFNRWPLITRHSPLLHFAEQAYFMVAGKKVSLEDAALAYYMYYSQHPEVVERNLALLKTEGIQL